MYSSDTEDTKVKFPVKHLPKFFLFKSHFLLNKVRTKQCQKAVVLSIITSISVGNDQKYYEIECMDILQESI